MATRLRIIFMGTAELATFSLKALLARPNWEVVAVVTQPDKPAGRDLRVRPSPVKVAALAHNLPVLQPLKARDPVFIEELKALEPDLIAVTAYGQILPQSLLTLPRYGCVNVHTSLLPKYRGAAPIQRAILNDEPQTGVTIMQMDTGLDTGGILAQSATPIAPEDTAETLHDRLGKLGAELLVETIPGLTTGKLVPQAQPAGATYAAKIQKQDGRIDWSHPARVAWNQVRALCPWPGTFCLLPGEPKGQMLKIWRAELVNGNGLPGEVLYSGKDGIRVACGQEALNILVLQREGGRRMAAAEFLAGHPLPTGTRLE